MIGLHTLVSKTFLLFNINLLSIKFKLLHSLQLNLQFCSFHLIPNNAHFYL